MKTPTCFHLHRPYVSRWLCMGLAALIWMPQAFAWPWRKHEPTVVQHARQHSPAPQAAQVNWYSRPQPDEAPAMLSRVFPDSHWWTAFGNADLNALVDRALSQNPSVQAARIRIQQASALVEVTRAAQFPAVDAGASYLLDQYGRHEFPYALPRRTYQFFQAPLTASYELDIWGKNRDNTKIARLGVDTAKFQYAGTRTQLAASVVTAYFNLAKLTSMLDAQTHLADNAKKALFHANRLFLLGQTPESNLNALQQQAQSVEADRAQLEGMRQIAERQLAALVGISPTMADPIPVHPLETLTLPDALQAGIPAGLLTHRPDIAMAEAALLAAHLNLSVARKMTLPSLKISGQTGFFSTQAGNWFRTSNLNNLVQAAVSQPIFRGGLLTGGIRYRKTDYEALLYDYQSTVLTAYQEVETSLAGWHADRSILRDISAQLAAVTRQTEQARQRVDAGIAAEPDWLVADAQRLGYVKAQYQQMNQVLMDTVGVLKAVGGGFETPTTLPSS